MYLDEIFSVYSEVNIMTIFLFKWIAVVAASSLGCIPPGHHFLNTSQKSSFSEASFSWEHFTWLCHLVVLKSLLLSLSHSILTKCCESSRAHVISIFQAHVTDFQCWKVPEFEIMEFDNLVVTSGKSGSQREWESSSFHMQISGRTVTLIIGKFHVCKFAYFFSHWIFVTPNQYSWHFRGHPRTRTEGGNIWVTWRRRSQLRGLLVSALLLWNSVYFTASLVPGFSHIRAFCWLFHCRKSPSSIIEVLSSLPKHKKPGMCLTEKTGKLGAGLRYSAVVRAQC